MTPVTNERVPNAPVIRHKEFAKRLEQACQNHAHAPSDHGKQKWLREELQDKYNIKVSREAVRKWFAGETRPRPKYMAYVARALEVDEAWLSLGITPELQPREQRKQNAVVNGAVNLTAGLIQLSGGHIAYPEDVGGDVDIYAIIGGRQHSINVRIPQPNRDGIRFTVPNHYSNSVIILVIPTDDPIRYNFLRLTPDVISEYGTKRGGYIDMTATNNNGQISIGGVVLKQIKSFDNLDGENSR